VDWATSTMKMRSYLLVLGQLSLLATITMSTTTKRLWSMAHRKTDVKYKLFSKLQGFAEICCEATYPKDNCGKMQLSYWVYDVGTAGNDPNFWERFNPGKGARKAPKGTLELTPLGKEMCGIIRSRNPDYPLYSSWREEGDEHTEAQVIPRMVKRAEANKKTPTRFFLWTTNSPCGPYDPDCKSKIFKFVATNLISKKHHLDVGFRTWAKSNRQLFCDDITLKKRAPYADGNTIDFYPHLAFWKINNDKYNPPDDMYNPGEDRLGKKC